MSTLELKIALSLHTESSVYQQAEARSAELAAARHGFKINVIYAGGDAITQSEQLLALIHADKQVRPDVIMLEPVGTSMVRVAHEAVKEGVGWIVLNRAVEYVEELRGAGHVPVFAVTTDHEETGRIQGRQLNALLPDGGSVVYLQGPTGHPVVGARTEGMMKTKNPNITIRPLHGQWQESTAFDVVSSWLKLPTVRESCPQVFAAQNDFMAMGARKAFSQSQVHESPANRNVRYIGCDGLEDHGYRWTSDSLLDATVVCPPLAEIAMEILSKEVRQGKAAEPLTMAQPMSFPSIARLRIV